MNQCMDNNVKSQKRNLRQKLKMQRSHLPEGYREQANELIRNRLKALESYQKASVIFSYVSMLEEVDTRSLISEALQEGKRVVVPRCEGKGIMDAYEISSLKDLVPGVWGIGEPGKHCRKVSPEDIDLCLIPCISTTRAGVRLGYGGGYYDRYLAKTRSKKVLLCWEQMLCEEIPQEIHDQKVDLVITEEQLIDIG